MSATTSSEILPPAVAIYCCGTKTSARLVIELDQWAVDTRYVHRCASCNQEVRVAW